MRDKILCVSFGIFIGSIFMLMLWPDRIAKLADGSEPIVTLNDKTYTADDYYKTLKDHDNIDVLLRMINVDLTKKIYGIQDNESTNYANERYDTFLAQTNSYGLTEEEALSQYGYSNKQDMIEFLKDDYYLNKYYTDKLSSRYSDEDLRKQYEDYYFPTRKVYLFSSLKKEDLDKAKKSLDKGSSAQSIISGNTVAYNDITYSFMDTYYSDTISTAMLMTSLNKTSNIFQDDTFGYAFVYVYEIEDNKSFEDVKDDILNYTLDKLEETDKNISQKIMLELQEENNILFKDTSLSDIYERYKMEIKK